GHRLRMVTFDGGERAPFFPLHPNIEHVPIGISTKNAPLLLKPFRAAQGIRRLREELLKNASGTIISFMDQANMLVLFAMRGEAREILVCEQIHHGLSSIMTSFLGPFSTLLNILRHRLYRQ